jgi:hypothetical protein
LFHACRKKRIGQGILSNPAMGKKNLKKVTTPRKPCTMLLKTPENSLKPNLKKTYNPMEQNRPAYTLTLIISPNDKSKALSHTQNTFQPLKTLEDRKISHNNFPSLPQRLDVFNKNF